MSPPRRRLSFPETASQDIITSARASLNAFGPINTLNVMNNSPQNKENSPLVARKKLAPQDASRTQEHSSDPRAPRKPNNTSFVLKPVTLPKPLQI